MKYQEKSNKNIIQILNGHQGISNYNDSRHSAAMYHEIPMPIMNIWSGQENIIQHPPLLLQNNLTK